MSDKCLVSVVLMCYNQKQYIPQALQCILQQQCSYPFEIVVGDDGSKDGSRELFLEYQQQYPDLIRIVAEGPNKGVLGNWRDTVNLCRGKYVAVCHCDDYWHNPLKLEQQINFLENNPEYGLVHTDAHFLLTSNGAVIEDYNSKHQKNIRDGAVFEDLIAGTYYLSTLTVCFKKSLFDEFVDINEFIKAGFIYEDLPTWLELSKRTKFKYLPVSTATYRIMQESVSRSKDLTKRFGFLKNHYVIKKYYIKKYNVSKELEEEFEIMYHRKKFDMAYRWCSYSEAVDSFTFLKERDKASTKLRLQKLFIRYPFLHSTLHKIKKLYVPKTAPSQV
jgi:glycosyltransferase involved in cell wall biosynthesis